MNPKEALDLLVQAAGLARLTKQDHVQLEQASVMLEKILSVKEKGHAKKAKSK